MAVLSRSWWRRDGPNLGSGWAGRAAADAAVAAFVSAVGLRGGCRAGQRGGSEEVAVWRSEKVAAVEQQGGWGGGPRSWKMVRRRPTVA